MSLKPSVEEFWVGPLVVRIYWCDRCETDDPTITITSIYDEEAILSKPGYDALDYEDARLLRQIAARIEQIFKPSVPK